MDGERQRVRTECAADVLIRETAGAQHDAGNEHADVEHVLSGG